MSDAGWAALAAMVAAVVGYLAARDRRPIDALKQEVAARDERVKFLEQALADRDTRLKAAEADRDERLKVLRERHAADLAEKDKHLRECEAARQAWGDDRRALEAEISRLEREVRDVEHQNRTLQQTVINKQETIARLEEEQRRRPQGGRR